MNSTKLLLSLFLSITTLNAAGKNKIFNIDDIPFTTTARGAPNQSYETPRNSKKAELPPLSLSQKTQNNQYENVDGIHDIPSSPKTKRETSNFPLTLITHKIQKESGFNNTFSSGGTPQTTDDPSKEIAESMERQKTMQDNANNGLTTASSTTELSSTNNFPGHKLGDCVKDNQSENDQESKAPANSPNAKDESN